MCIADAAVSKQTLQQKQLCVIVPVCCWFLQSMMVGVCLVSMAVPFLCFELGTTRMQVKHSVALETLESIFVNRRVLYFKVDGVTCHLSVVAARTPCRSGWWLLNEVLHKQSWAADEHIGVGWGAKCLYVLRSPTWTILPHSLRNGSKTKLRCLSPRANYTDRPTAACRRS
jgi:hypothetical protein